MTQQAELLNIVNTLPQKYFGEVIDFVEYLQYKAQQEAAQQAAAQQAAAQLAADTKEQRAAKEKAAFIKYADELNAEAEDVLKYQVPLFEGDDE